MDASPDTDRDADRDPGRDDKRKRLLIGLGAAVAVALVVVAAVAFAGDDDEPVVAEGTTTTTTSTTTPETSSTEATTTTAPDFATVDPATPVFPDPTTSRRFDSPESVAQAFATDLVGMTAPVLGEYRAGDARSGEIDVRALDDGPPTVVLVRQLEDDTWFVIGAETDSIRLATPAARAEISSPQPLEGQAYAFEGTVDVRLYADGTTEPIAETFVTGRGDGVLGDFTGELAFTAPAGATHGVLVLTSEGGEDGAPLVAQVLRVAF